MSVFMSVCLSAFRQTNSKCYEEILMTFSGSVDNGPKSSSLNFDHVLDGL